MFTPDEKARLRHHMGYLNVSEVSTFSLGVPAAVETQYLIEGAMNRVLPEAEPIVRGLMAVMDIINAQMTDDLELLAVKRVDEIELRSDEMTALRTEYKFRQRELANVLGIEPNTYDQRFKSRLNIPVNNGL